MNTIQPTYFSERETARRYHFYRPKVQEIILRKVARQMAELPLESALDVACGTGDSARALCQIANRVVGVDTSKAMLAYAEGNGLETRHLAAERVSELDERFDLLSACMAFHWLDLDLAIPEMKSVTRPGGYWLIYNFAFDGHSHSEAFNVWWKEVYLRDFPAPSRGTMNMKGRVSDDPDMERVWEESGELGLRFSLDELVMFFTTQSNVEAATRKGYSFEEIEALLKGYLEGIDISGKFLYRYWVELLRFGGASS